VNYRLRELSEQIIAYRVDNIGSDESARLKVFEFAKAINAPLIITSADVSDPATLDALAQEFGINVALESKSDPKSVLASLTGRSRRMGIAADLAGWMQEGIKPVDGLSAVKDRLLIVEASDRTALGPKARAVPLGDGAGGLGDFFLAAFRAGIKPLAITV